LIGGRSGDITAFADAGGSPNKVTVTSASHGLSNGDRVKIKETTHYDKSYYIEYVNTNTFNIIHLWNGNDANGYWGHGKFGIRASLRLEHVPNHWSTDANGIQVKNLYYGHITIEKCEGFQRGLHLLSDVTGISYNQFRLDNMVENKIGIDFECVHSGWINQNAFYGGKFSYYSGGNQSSGYAGGRHINIPSYSPNTPYNNIFYSPSFECDDIADPNTSQPDYYVYCGGRHNAIIQPYSEGTPSSGYNVCFTSASYGNVWEAGRPTDITKFLDDGNNNRIETATTKQWGQLTEKADGSITAGGTIEGGSITTAGTIEGGSITTAGTIQGEKFKSTGCTIDGTSAVAFGSGTEASGNYSTATGYDTIAIGSSATAMGNSTTASGSGSTAMGYDTTASGYYSTAMGAGTTASGVYASTAMGYNTTASGEYSTAMGYSTTANGYRSTAMGDSTTTGGYRSTAIGYFTTAGASPIFASYTTAIGSSFTNNVQSSFAVGYGQKDFSVESGLVHVYGDLKIHGDLEPKTLELQLQERNGVIERYEKYVTPDKKSGVVYINSETKLIEVYYPYEGVIRNIQGQTIYSLPSIRINNDYETYYVFDTLAGQVVEKQNLLCV